MENKKKNTPLRTWDEVEKEYFTKNPKEIYDYLKVSIEENADLPEALIYALRTTIEVLDLSIEKLAKKAQLQPSTVYKALGKKGNPTIQTLNALLGALGLRLSIEKKAG